MSDERSGPDSAWLKSETKLFSAVRLLAKVLHRLGFKPIAVALLRLFFGDSVAPLRTREGKCLYVNIDQDLPRVLTGADWKRFNKNNFFPAIESLLEPGTLIFDVGASHGLEALHFAEAVGKDGLVIAIEPNPVSFRSLKMTLERNLISNVIPLQIGVGSAFGYIENAPRLRGQDYTVGDKPGPDKIEIRTLDDIYEEYGEARRVSLIKSDTDGFELEVLAGARRIIERHPEVAILAEYTPAIDYSGKKGLATLLEYKDRGFNLFKIQPAMSAIDEEDLASFSGSVNDPRNMICHDIVLRPSSDKGRV